MIALAKQVICQIFVRVSQLLRFRILKFTQDNRWLNLLPRHTLQDHQIKALGVDLQVIHPVQILFEQELTERDCAHYVGQLMAGKKGREAADTGGLI